MGGGTRGFSLLINIQFESLVSLIRSHYLLLFGGLREKGGRRQQGAGGGLRWKDKGRKRKAGLISARPHANLLCKLAVKSIPGTALKRDFLGECAGSAVGRSAGRPAGRGGGG